MVVSKVIQGYLDSLREKLSQFPIEPYYVFDPDLDFMLIGNQYISRSGIFEKIEGQPPQKWILIMWNRGSLTQNTLSNRPFKKVPDFNANTMTDFRYASLNMDVAFICSDIDLAESLEEILFVYFPETNGVFSFDLGNLGELDGNSFINQNITFERGSLQNTGSLTKITLNCDLSFPLVIDTNKNIPIIEEINYNIWEKDGNILIGSGYIK